MVTPSPRKSKVPNILGDWDDVRFFLAVAKTGSFSAAATQLNTKQTTVGRRIQALERRLGAKLFDRHRHGMLPNTIACTLTAVPQLSGISCSLL